jgi:ribosomal protein S27E
MNLIACDSCGVVLDAEKLPFPEDYYNSDRSDRQKYQWCFKRSERVPYVACPVCQGDILKPS